MTCLRTLCVECLPAGGHYVGIFQMTLDAKWASLVHGRHDCSDKGRLQNETGIDSRVNVLELLYCLSLFDTLFIRSDTYGTVISPSHTRTCGFTFIC